MLIDRTKEGSFRMAIAHTQSGRKVAFRGLKCEECMADSWHDFKSDTQTQFLCKLVHQIKLKSCRNAVRVLVVTARTIDRNDDQLVRPESLRNRLLMQIT